MKSGGQALAAQNRLKSSSQALAAVAGPPTCRRGEIALTAVHVALNRSKYFAWPPVQNATRLGSFHTSSGHCATSSTP